LYTSKIFKSEQRKEVLRLCEYTDPVYEMAGSTQFEDRIRKLLENGEVSRAAMYALFCRKIWRAVQILEESDQPEISLMISGFTEKFQSQWHLNAERNAKRYKDQHVRAMLNFLTKRYTDESECEEILGRESQLNVQDRVAFACVYLHDNKLPRFIENLARELYDCSSLMGLFVTGFTYKCVMDSKHDYYRYGFDHLECYMRENPELRLQDVIFAALYAVYPALDDENKLLLEWITRYKDLLNSIQFFVQRAKFEKMMHKLLDPLRKQPKSEPAKSLYKMCVYCTKPVVSQKKPLGGGISAHRRGKAKPNLQEGVCICSVKNESKLICAICNFDDVQSERPPNIQHSKIAKFWVVCGVCQHGGHAECYDKWFQRASRTCPYAECICGCDPTRY